MLIGENPIGSRPGIGESYIVRTKAYTMDQWVVFTGSEPLGDGEYRYYLNRNYGACIQKSDILNFAMNYCASNAVNKSYYMAIGLKYTIQNIAMSTSLVPAYELTIPSTSVMSALVWSWAETFDSVWRKMETMANALKLEHATDTYLDDAWGQIFDLPRIYQETDTAYRDRLKTRTTILTSSGTKSNCETIIDSILGMFGETTVTTRYPSSVQITFSSIDAMRIAKEKQDTLNYLIPQMIAAGISYSLCLPFIDYVMNAYVNGPFTLSHTMRYSLAKPNTDITYNIDILNNIQKIFSHDIDTKIMNYDFIEFIVGSFFVINKTKPCPFNISLFGTQLSNFIMNVCNKKRNIPKNIIISEYIKKYDINKTHTMIMSNKSSLRRIYKMGYKPTYQLFSEYDLDLFIRLFMKSISINIYSKRSHTKRYSASIKLVGE